MKIVGILLGAMLVISIHAAQSPWSNIATVRTKHLTPVAPTNFVTLAVSSNQVDLAWLLPSTNGVQRLRIHRAVGSTNLWLNLVVISNVTTKTYSDTNAVPSATNYYRIAAENDDTNSAWSAVASAQTPSGDLSPSPPSNPVATAVSSSRIDLTWTDNSNNETGFKIERSLSSTGPWVQVGETAANVTSYSDNGLQPSTTYYYRVCAWN